jgi:hypothetical protein
MFGSDIIDAAIGLFLVYFLFSVLCSSVNEWVLGHILGARAKILEASIERLLGSPDLKQEFYELPLIKTLAAKEGAKPAYISSSTFVDALLSLVREKAKGTDGVVDDRTLDRAARDLGQLLALLRDRLAGQPVQETLTSLLGGALTLQDGRKKLEAWFDEGMDRATGLYKRHAQVWTVCLAAAVVVFFNADTVSIIQELVTDTRLRAALVSTAEATVKQGTANAPPNDSSNSVATVEAKIQNLGVPIGWSWHTNGFDPSTKPATVSRTLLSPGEGWPTKVGGLFVTICAVSLGAPFWFDLLGKIVNLRAAGRKPDAEPKRKQQ